MEELVDSGSVFVGSVEGLVVGRDVASDVVVDVEPGSGEKIRQEKKGDGGVLTWGGGGPTT